ncbi:penicillin-binding protein [Brachybacterium endophyticum]|uniref:Penicillin-binding protein n=1 Tax=Brachybacterium endophyticum TaxID=2182385 RepID=A0A2U2RJC1_9MICO|nr:transglycosylase domain-containing protein [Brachybacterium endophyticum]PWH05963.1 penicillin-binding protein [Brachybacterium endophyticum]
MSDSRGPSRPSSGSGQSDAGKRRQGASGSDSSTRKAFPGSTGSGSRSGSGQGRSAQGRGAGSGAGAGGTSEKHSSRTGRSSGNGGRSSAAAAGSGRTAGTARSSADGKTAGSSKGTSRTARRAGAAGAAGAGAGAANRPAKSASSAGAGRRGTRATKKPARRNGFAAALNYPRAGKKGAMRWFPSFRLLGGTLGLLILLGLGGGIWLYNSIAVPQADDVAVAQTSRVYFSDGKTEMGQFSEVNRTIIPNDEMPQTVKDAVVASEDSSFYENRGVSPKGIARALWNNLSGGSRQGASTITQQYVERYYTGTTTSYAGKVKEMIMALKADQELSKDEILSRYLNTIYFGRDAYGIQAASQAYFGKDAKDLDESEAALLVAVIPAPSTYDPANDEQASAKKWDRVITREVTQTGALTEAQADKLKFPETQKKKKQNYLKGTNGYLLMMVHSELEREGYSEQEINTKGFKIVSTIDKKDQEATVDTIKGLKDEGRPKKNRTGTMSIEPGSGAITAMYGGPDFVEQSINDATQSRMQAGSIFKTFALVAGLQNGYGLNSTWDGDSPRSFGGWKVNNFGHTSYGPVTLKEATTDSVNTAYAGMNVAMGADKTQEEAIKLGLPKDTPGLDGDVTNVLGTASPTVREMAEAYATIADNGVYHKSYIVKSVQNSDGSDEYEHEDSSKRVLDKKVAINATVALQGPPSTGSAKSVKEAMNGRPVAGKTGTSENFKSAWFVGFTPQMVTAVGMFQPSADNTSEEALTPFGGVTSMTGGSWPATIWGRIMSQSLEGEPIQQFQDPVILDNQKSQAGNATTPPPTTKAPSTTTKAPTTEAPSTTSKAPTTTTSKSEKPSKSPSEEPSDDESDDDKSSSKTTEKPSSKPPEEDEDEDKPSSKPPKTTSDKPTSKPTKDKPSSKPKPTKDGDKEAGGATSGTTDTTGGASDGDA